MDIPSPPSNKDSRPVVAAVTFIVILIGLGIPVWWNTTAVQRAYFSLDELSNLQLISGNDHSLTIVYGTVDSFKKANERSEYYDYISNTSVNSNFKFIEWTFKSEELEVLASLHSVEAVDSYMKELDIHDHLDGLWIIEVSSKLLSPKKMCIGRYNFLYISKETGFQLVSEMFESMLAAFDSSNTDLKTLLPLSHEYSILLTIATSNPAISYSDFIDMFEGNVDAFANQFSTVANLAISSQVVYIGDQTIKSNLNSEEGFHFLNEGNTVSLINILEPRLGGQLSSNPSFHWVFYVPNPKQSPLYIFNNSQPIATNSILSPRWNGGGLQIVNQIDPSSSGLILSQLRKALGIVSIHLKQDKTDSNIFELGYDESGIHEWEVYFLKRQRTVQFFNQAIKTLKSLAELLKQIGNIVVSEDIRDLIMTSVIMGKESKIALQNNHLQEAYICSQKALKSAEKAFFDPSLLALLYFPEDQKYAIYIPLFLPVGIPILLSLRSVYQHFLKM